MYELSKAERHTLGRNRKGIDVQRNFGHLINTTVTNQNKLYTLLEQQYQVEGFEMYKLYIFCASNTFLSKFL